MRTLLAALCALTLAGAASNTSAQAICWDTVCAAGTPAADCWRAWCPTTSYQAPPSPYTYGGARYWGFESPIPMRMAPTTPLQGCSTGRLLDWLAWNC